MAFVCFAVALHFAPRTTTVVFGAQMATADRIQESSWWPTHPSTRRSDYVGADRCALCHPRQAATQRTTPMARTAAPAAASAILPAGTRLTFKHAGYEYVIAANESDVTYSVERGNELRSARLAWAFGEGKVGQSFLFERGGSFHEARVSYYDSMRALDFTPSRGIDDPRNLDEAMSRTVPQAEARRCFACHTTASATDGTFNPGSAAPGVMCEACHGPGRRHVEAIAARRTGDARKAVLNPARLAPADSVDFCGACHATFWDVKLADQRGVAAMRSQPYRLQSSRCWTGGDARLTCIACHNPHLSLVHDAATYDSRCLGCHRSKGADASSDRTVRACRVADAKCVSCHMPKYEVPGMHHAFTDHLIRVVAER